MPRDRIRSVAVEATAGSHEVLAELRAVVLVQDFACCAQQRVGKQDSDAVRVHQPRHIYDPLIHRALLSAPRDLTNQVGKDRVGSADPARQVVNPCAMAQMVPLGQGQIAENGLDCVVQERQLEVEVHTLSLIRVRTNVRTLISWAWQLGGSTAVREDGPVSEDNPWDDVPLLEVVVLHVKDAVAATDGGADRLLLVAEPGDVGVSPDLAAVSAVVKATDLPVRIMLRRGEGHEISPDQVDALAEFGEAASALGAAGFSFGFLDRMLEIDTEACSELASRVRLPWAFHRGFDSSLDSRRAWRAVLGLPGLDAVASAGSSRGMSAGADELLRHAGNRRIAGLLMASGALEPEQVPWLVRAGVRQFGVGATVRPGRSWTRSFVDVDHVRTWRMLLDDAVARARGIPVD